MVFHIPMEQTSTASRVDEGEARSAAMKSMGEVVQLRAQPAIMTGDNEAQLIEVGKFSGFGKGFGALGKAGKGLGDAGKATKGLGDVGKAVPKDLGKNPVTNIPNIDARKAGPIAPGADKAVPKSAGPAAKDGPAMSRPAGTAGSTMNLGRDMSYPGPASSLVESMAWHYWHPFSPMNIGNTVGYMISGPKTHYTCKDQAVLAKHNIEEQQKAGREVSEKDVKAMFSLGCRFQVDSVVKSNAGKILTDNGATGEWEKQKK